MVINVTKRRFFSVKLLVLFPFLDAHYRALEGKAIAISMDSYFSLLMHDALLLHYLSNALTVTNGNLAWVRTKKYPRQKYYVGWGQARYIAEVCLLFLCLVYNTLTVLLFEDCVSGSVRIWSCSYS